MAVITYPTNMPGPESCRWELASNTQVSISPLSGQVQTQELPGARWRVSIDYPPVRDAAIRATMRAFFASMRGQANRVDLWPFDCPRLRGTGAGTPLVNGASQTGASLITDGWTAATTVLKGDYLSVGQQLFMASADGTASGGGAMTISVEPPIRTSPADNAAITITKPKARFMLADPTIGWRIDSNFLTGFSADFIEVFS
jgi:hypothetical protein